MEKFSAEDLMYLVSHRGAVAHKLNSVILELSLASTPEDAAAGKASVCPVLIPVEHVEKVIGSLQQSLATLRRSN